METTMLNIALAEILEKWDPFLMGQGEYAPEIADVIQLVHEKEDVNELAKSIQDVFEFSFEDRISMDICVDMAKKLLQEKWMSSCS
jgi:hypothetical protein